MSNPQTRQAIEEAIRHFSELSDAKNQLILNRLDTINDHLSKQNGSIASTLRRIAALESEHARRELICPHRQTINKLLLHKSEINTIKKYVRNWVLIATAIANTLIALFAWLINQN